MLSGARRRAWAAPRASRCGSTPTSMPARTPRSPPAARRTSSASRMPMPPRCTPAPRPCRASSRSAWRRISAARSCPSRRTAPPSRRIADLVRDAARGRACAVDVGRLRRRPRHPAIATSRRHRRRRSPGRSAARCTIWMSALVVEPGRWLVGPAGVLLASVMLVEADAGQPLRGAGCGDERPGAARDVRRLARHRAGLRRRCRRRRAARPMSSGRSASRGDTFARNRMLPPLAPGARVAILDAGAYGSVMSSTYNARPLAAEVMVDGEQLVGDPRPRSPRSTCGAASACQIGWNDDRTGLTPRRDRSPAAPARRPARAGALRHPVRARSGRRCGRRSALPALFVCVALLDLPRLLPPGAHVGLLALTGVADRSGCWSAGCPGIAAPDDKAADRRLEVASGLPHRPLAVLTDRPARPGDAVRRRALAGACRARRALRCAGCASACRVPAWRGAIRVPCAAALVVALVAALGDRRRRMRRRGWRGAWSRRCRAPSRRRRPSCRPGSRRPPIRGWRRSSSSRTAARCRCRPAST